MAAVRARRGGMPLSFVIGRYFAYSFAAVAAAWLVSFAALFAAIKIGWVYEASWGPANVRDVAERLADSGIDEPADVPTAYGYLVMGDDGKTLMTDLEGARFDRAEGAALAALGAEPGAVRVEGGGSGLTCAAFPISGGGSCALVSDFLPQWVSRGVAEAAPNPQGLMLASAVLGSALALALTARRASSVIARKMAPLTEAAGRVGAGELDFAVGRTSVREVNDVLGAMDEMRSSLSDSLEARWAAERSQREQVASLAHDLKTPLTVMRANAEFIAEELGEEDGNLAAASRDIAGGAERLDGYVRLLIEASRGSAGPGRSPARPSDLCGRIVAEAGQVARARGVRFDARVDPAVAGADEASLDLDALSRAAGNLVFNAAEHSLSAVAVRCGVEDGFLVVEVSDDGPGFSPAALERGCERLFTDDSSRRSAGGGRHYGIGLHAASESARAHGGSVALANAPSGGALATMWIPLRGVEGEGGPCA